MKLKKLREWMKKKKINTVLLYNAKYKDTNVLYYTGINDGGLYLVVRKDKAILFCSPMDYDLVKKTSDIKNVRKYDLEFKNLKKELKGKKIGINKDVITLIGYKILRKRFKGKKFVDVSKGLSEVREVKDNREIQRIRKACKIGDEVYSLFLKNFNKFKTEEEAEKFIVDEIKKKKCDVSFEPLVASGISSSFPHSKIKRRIVKGFCYVDMGVKYKGYCSDMTRVLYKGKPKKQELDDFMWLYDIFFRCEKKAMPGVGLKKVDDIARKGLGDLFIHGLGHGVGVEIHESPSFGPYSKGKIRENMVFTIEPGLYRSGKYGLRLENTYLCGKKGVESLCKTPMSLMIIK